MIQLESIRSFPIEEYLLTRLAFSPDGSEIAVGHKRFRTYSAETGEVRAEFDFSDFLAQLRYSPDGAYIAAVNVGDNHPATRGRIGVFRAADGKPLWSADAALPIETCAFGTGEDPLTLHWNRPHLIEGGQPQASLAGAQVDPHRELAETLLPQFQVRSLACSGSGREPGFVCFGREAVGTVQQVEGADLVFRKFRLL